MCIGEKSHAHTMEYWYLAQSWQYECIMVDGDVILGGNDSRLFLFSLIADATLALHRTLALCRLSRMILWDTVQSRCLPSFLRRSRCTR